MPPVVCFYKNRLAACYARGTFFQLICRRCRACCFVVQLSTRGVVPVVFQLNLSEMSWLLFFN